LAVTLSMASTTKSRGWPLGSQNALRGSLIVEERHTIHGGFGVDKSQALAEYLRFGFPDSPLHSLKLTVGVGDAHHIEVYQVEMPDTASGEGLGSEASHSTQADHGYPRVEEGGHPVVSHQPAYAIETPMESVFFIYIWPCGRCLAHAFSCNRNSLRLFSSCKDQHHSKLLPNICEAARITLGR
jgi:hypothetical protein